MSPLLQGSISERFTEAVLAEPHRLRYSILKSDHVVLPVSHMVPNYLAENGVAEIEGIEVHVEGIYQPRTVIIYDDGTAIGTACLSSAVGLDTI